MEPAETGYRFRHALVRDAVLATFPPHERSREGGEVAERLADLGAPATRVAHLFLASGHPVQAIPYARQAVETAGALGAYRDGLALIDAVLDHASDDDRGHLLARRGDMLLALADPAAVATYRAALSLTTGTENRLVRARLARAATFQGDYDTAASALAGLELEGDMADGPMLLARGGVAYFTGDFDAAYADADGGALGAVAGRPVAVPRPGLAAGFDRTPAGRVVRAVPASSCAARSTTRSMATAIFDAHLCVAEYMLYGPVPYDEVIELAEQLRRRAQQHGALRGAAFATALIGEAALLMGDLELAERELTEAAELHRDVDAAAGEAHSLQRLAEVHLARGDRDEARELLHRALPLARWSAISLHLMQRVYGSMIARRPRPGRRPGRRRAGRARPRRHRPLHLLRRDVRGPRRHRLRRRRPPRRRPSATSPLAEISAARWSGSAWTAAVAEARAHLAAAEGDDDGFRRRDRRGRGAVRRRRAAAGRGAVL